MIKNNVQKDNDYVLNFGKTGRASTAAEVNIPVRGDFSKKFTIEFRSRLIKHEGSFPVWINVNTTLGKTNAGYDFVLWAVQLNNTGVRINRFGEDPNSVSLIGPANSTPLNTWNHIVFSVEQGVEIALYINGTKYVASITSCINFDNGVASKFVTLFQGIDNNSYHPFGHTRCLRIYEKFAAAQADVDVMYSGVKDKAVAIPQSLKDKLYAEYLFNQKNGDYAIDTSGNNRNYPFRETTNITKLDFLNGGGIWRSMYSQLSGLVSETGSLSDSPNGSVTPATYSVTVFARSESMSSAQQAKIMYKINGGSSVQLGSAFTVTTDYQTIGTITDITNGATLDIGAQDNTVSNDIVFSASQSTAGVYSGFLGLFTPYTEVVGSNINVYIRIDLDGSGLFREA